MKTDKKTATETPSNQFSFIVGDVRKGALLARIEDTLREVIASVKAKGRAGELVLKLKIAPASGSETSTVTVSGTVSAKLPPEKAISQLYFTNPEGGLQKNDPDQRELPLRAVEKAEDGKKPVAAAL